MKMIYEVETKKLFSEAVESLKESLSNNNFGVLWELNFKDKLEEKGLEFDNNFKIFEVCNPKQAKEVLERHLEVGYFLPCKIVIYEKDDSVKIGMLKPSELIDIMDDQELSKIGAEVEKELKTAIDRAAN
ncbi:DUF302 domain-containing protein [Clostridium sp. D2Q-11]|uniref:DUF302 domain-containing protein n=1 Tax=Anaeromonas frigoriresistens TaxID=2683708 RepID=A0A942UTE7_9FIRM|nr:DUF302 domain-containing protein [Anaeromonas frigoriresistens]MBS4538243.1 DUF302 domain-containing protein [Anaeromonas frigoriresistens]